MEKLRTYSELIKLKTFRERYEYLKLDSIVGDTTFDSFRWLNQAFYTSSEWRTIRDKCIVRDLGCDLGVDGMDISGFITIHHMNPVAVSDIKDRTDILLDPEYLICVSDATHKAIHYGDSSFISKTYVERSPNDTTLWKKGTNWKAFFDQ